MDTIKNWMYLSPGTTLFPQRSQQAYCQVCAGHVVDEHSMPIHVATTTCECSFASGVPEI